jgi:hypothetical protein
VSGGRTFARRLSGRSPNPSQHFAVTFGRTPLGTIDVIDGYVYVAADTNGTVAGRFQTLRKAADALGDRSAS